jgi:hypothetical protein
MKPRDVFCAILKAIGVMFWGYALEELPSAIQYMPYFYKLDETTSHGRTPLSAQNPTANF